ncbi:hypothetical protein PIB30_030724 [Stylosanthes scabra]|uniref:Uncharacterized protein n=1 Tax=Stylosanthes scabra TaxID=79078 RepID=A0ABU6VEQ2_9FABA|nr:hypothetical protein [Stylosanthes scabra]
MFESDNCKIKDVELRYKLQESVNKSKTVTNSKGRGEIIDANVMEGLANDLDERPIGQFFATKKARVNIKKEKVHATK